MDAPFLRLSKSPGNFSNVTKWKRDQLKTYVTKSVVPPLASNISFLAVALVCLVVFLLWRIIRRCCMCSCMRESCETKRRAAEPDKVLSGWLYWAQKGVLLLLCIAAFSVMIAGIAVTPKQLFVRVWPPVNRLTGYLTNTTARMDQLVNGTLGGINPILDSLTSLVNNDINLPVVKTNLQSIATTLDWAAANPINLINALNNLNASMVSVRSQIAALRPQLGAGGLPTTLTTLQAGLPGLSEVVAACQDYSTRLAGLDPPFTTLSAASGPTYNTGPLETAMAAVQADAWRTSLATMLGALDVWRSLRSGNTLAALANTTNVLKTAANDLKLSQLPATATTLQAFSSAWAGVSANLGLLLYRIDYVQTYVVQLDPASNAVIQTLQSLYGNVSGLTDMQPSPSSLAANLTALALNVTLGPVADLVTQLNNAQAAINQVPQSVLDGARDALGNLKTALDNLSPKFIATQSALAAYKANQNQANFNALKSSGVDAGNTWDLSKTAKSKAAFAAADTNVFAVQTAAANGSLNSLADVKSLASSVNSALGAADTNLAAAPSLAPYTSATTSIKSVYDALPTPKSKELDVINKAVSDIENVLVAVPNTVRNQTASFQKSFGSGVQQLRTKVIAKANDFQVKRTASVKRLDQIRYSATCGLLALAIIFLVALIVFAAINCPWGIACAIFFLLVLAALLLLMAAVFAAVLVVADGGCSQAESVVLDTLGNGSSVTPLVKYYFYGDNSTSVKGVLKSANLVDIDKVTAEVTDQANVMIDNITSQFPPKVKLSAIISDVRQFITTTQEEIDSLLAVVSVSAVRPLYLDLKSYPCCEVTGAAYKLWIALTLGGWLLSVACIMSMSLLGRLDQLPQSGCCGCKPLIGKRLHNKNAAIPGDGGLVALGPCTAQIRPVSPGGRGKEGDEEGGALKAIALAPDQQTMPTPAVTVSAAAAASPSPSTRTSPNTSAANK